MKKIFSAVGVVFLFLSCVTLADDDCFVIGYHPPGTHTYDGPTWCNAVHFKNIIVRGPLYTNGSDIDGMTEVSGPIQAIGSHFQTIQIDNNGSSETVSLKKSSEVEGNVTFLGPFGLVLEDHSSRVHGKVINGKESKA